jgi:hypothetical protein
VGGLGSGHFKLGHKEVWDKGIVTHHTSSESVKINLLGGYC